MKDKYVLEINAEEAFVLYDIIRHDKLYEHTDKKEITKKLAVICKNLKRPL